ncbi:MAG: SRPBCC family protein [Flavobacterium sp.]
MKIPDIKLPVIDKNIGDLERAVSILGGAYLLYHGLRKKHSVLEVIAGGLMIARGATGYCPASAAGQRLMHRAEKPKDSNINIHARLIIKRPMEEVYNFWRHLGNLPLFMEHLESVTVLSETRSEWKAKLPGGIGSVTWNAEIVAEEPYRYIGWQSTSGSLVKNAGKVTFKDAGELGTLVHIVFSYHAPLGVAGEEIGKLLNPYFEKMVRKDIMGFKRFMETGTAEVISQETRTIFT